MGKRQGRCAWGKRPRRAGGVAIASAPRRRKPRSGRYPLRFWPPLAIPAGRRSDARSRNRQHEGLGRRGRARSSSWSSRSLARISAPPRAPWRISACRGCGWSRRGSPGPTTRRTCMAAGADRILDGAELFDGLEAAIADCTFVVGRDRARPRSGQARGRRGRKSPP